MADDKYRRIFEEERGGLAFRELFRQINEDPLGVARASLIRLAGAGAGDRRGMRRRKVRRSTPLRPWRAGPLTVGSAALAWQQDVDHSPRYLAGGGADATNIKRATSSTYVTVAAPMRRRQVRCW